MSFLDQFRVKWWLKQQRDYDPDIERLGLNYQRRSLLFARDENICGAIAG